MAAKRSRREWDYEPEIPIGTRLNQKTTRSKRVVFSAERVGFEPTVPYGTRALQARALGRTMLSLHLAVIQATRIIPDSQGLGKPRPVNNQGNRKVTYFHRITYLHTVNPFQTRQARAG
jgi:hypothetical protein